MRGSWRLFLRRRSIVSEAKQPALASPPTESPAQRTVRQWIELATVIGNLSQGVAAVAACLALWIGFHQIHAASELQRQEDEAQSQRQAQQDAAQSRLQSQQIAYNAYYQMLSASIDYPDFVCVDTDEKLERLKRTRDPQSRFGATLFTRYVSFRQITFAALERILIATPGEEDWMVSVRLRLKCFRPYMRSDHFSNDTDARYKGWKCPMREQMAIAADMPKFRCSEKEKQEEQQKLKTA